FLDGVPVAGRTPVQVLLNTHEFHLLRAEKDGYQAALRGIAPEPRDAAVTLSLALERRPVGTVFVESGAPAEVWIDGSWSGCVTPTLGMRLPEGEHLIEVRDGTAAASERVRLEAGRTVHLQLHPEAAPGPAGRAAREAR